MSKIIQIGEHKVPVPQPKKKEEILFIDHKDPCWNRDQALLDYKTIWYDFVPGRDGTRLYQSATLYDQDGNLISLNKEDSDWMIWAYEREWHRRTYGVFFKNGQDIDWLTGDHWFTLAWCKTKRPDKVSDYFDYREFQAHYFYLINYVNNSPLIDGLDISKAKKTGITNLHWCYYLNKSTMTKNINSGNMNIDQGKGAKTFRDHFMYAYNGLASPLKPSIKTKSEADGIITFGERVNNSKKGRSKNASAEELNTTVMCVPTMVNAFDVDVFADLWYDEPPKYTKDFGEIFRSNEAGTNIQDISVGKKWLTSYTPEGEAPSFLAAKKIFYDSELRTITPESGGRTLSKMICHHIPAYQSWGSAFNKNGKCNEVEAMRRIQVRRDQLRDTPRELLAETRRYANNKREAWSAGGSGSIFDGARLAEIMYNIEEEQRSSPTTPYLEGKLEWSITHWELGLKNKRPKGEFCPVKFVPITEKEKRENKKGRLRIYNDIPDVQKNSILKNGRDEWGCIIPPDVFRSFLGADPTQHAAASEVIEGSKNAYYCMSAKDQRLDSLMGGIASGVMTFEYFERPELPDEAYEDLLKLIIYTGSLCTVEANVPEMATRLMTEGLGRFMLIKDKHGAYKIWERWMGLPHEEEKEYHLIRTTSNNPQTRELLEYFVRLIISFIKTPDAGEKSYGDTLKSERLVDQLLRVDITDTKIFDLFMAWGYALFTQDQYTAILLSGQNNNNSSMSFGSLMNALSRA
jgi:hypothetical protein